MSYYPRDLSTLSNENPSLETRAESDPFRTVKSVSATLNNDQILALPTTGVLIVPAAGVGKLVIPVSAIAVLDNTAGAYVTQTSPNLPTWALVDDTASNLSAPMEVYNALNFPAKSIVQFGIPFFRSYGQGDSSPFAGIATTNMGTPMLLGDNRSIFIQDALNGVSNYTGGDPANTLKVVVYYGEITL